jgi:hypothetical protein
VFSCKRSLLGIRAVVTLRHTSESQWEPFPHVVPCTKGKQGPVMAHARESCLPATKLLVFTRTSHERQGISRRTVYKDKPQSILDNAELISTSSKPCILARLTKMVQAAVWHTKSQVVDCVLEIMERCEPAQGR